MENNINHPKHYNQLPIECIDVVKHFDFIIGNVIKYCWRAGLKGSDNELQDLKKAKFYLEYKIKMIENMEDYKKEYRTGVQNWVKEESSKLKINEEEYLWRMVGILKLLIDTKAVDLDPFNV